MSDAVNEITNLTITQAIDYALKGACAHRPAWGLSTYIIAVYPGQYTVQFVDNDKLLPLLLRFYPDGTAGQYLMSKEDAEANDWVVV